MRQEMWSTGKKQCRVPHLMIAERVLTPSIKTTAAAFATPLKTIFYPLSCNLSAELRCQLPYLPGCCWRGHPERDRRSFLYDVITLKSLDLNFPASKKKRKRRSCRMTMMRKC